MSSSSDNMLHHEKQRWCKRKAAEGEGKETSGKKPVHGFKDLGKRKGRIKERRIRK